MDNNGILDSQHEQMNDKQTTREDEYARVKKIRKTIIIRKKSE